MKQLQEPIRIPFNDRGNPYVLTVNPNNMIKETIETKKFKAVYYLN